MSIRILSCLLVLLVGRFTVAEVPPIQLVDSIPASHITAIAGGGAVIASEDHGVFLREPGSEGWTQYTTKTGLADDLTYAAAVDAFGRVWIGTLNKGVCVYDPKTKQWTNYDAPNGPIGERIFDIRICPVDNDVWIATSAGLTRYSIKTPSADPKELKDSWRNYTRIDGLPEDQANSLAFDKEGNLYIGTQSHGVCVLRRDTQGEYVNPTTTAAPPFSGAVTVSKEPLTPNGEGLPSNMVNRMLVDSHGTVWAGTNAGLAWSTDQGKSWNFLRGRNYADKVRGLYGGVPENWEPCSDEEMEKLLPEDYITALVEAPDGKLWIGFREKGIAIIDPKTKEPLDPKNPAYNDALDPQLKAPMQPPMTFTPFVTSIAFTSAEKVILGVYANGDLTGVFAVSNPPIPVGSDATPSGERVVSVPGIDDVTKFAAADAPAMPNPPAAPTVAELDAFAAKLVGLNEEAPDVFADYLGEDWRTQGNWVGHYGRDMAIVCATGGYNGTERNHVYSTDPKGFRVNPVIGPNTTNTWKGYSNHYIFKQESDLVRAPYVPTLGLRRIAEWNDWEQQGDKNRDGADLWVHFTTDKEGMFEVDFYYYNKDGHVNRDRLRDQLIEVWPAPFDWSETVSPTSNDEELGVYSASMVFSELDGPPLLRTRVENYWGGVHKRLLLKGPGKYAIKMNRCYGGLVILQMVNVDRLPKIDKQIREKRLTKIYGTDYGPPEIPKEATTELGKKALELWKKLDGVYRLKGGAAFEEPGRLLAYRAAVSSGETALAEALAFRLNIWNEKEVLRWNDAMEESKKNLVKE